MNRGFGIASLLTAFGVLSLMVFAMLTLVTAQSDSRLSMVSASAVQSYYAADSEANKILAELKNNEVPDGVSVSDGEYAYSCPITEYMGLSITVSADDFEVLSWQIREVR